MTDHVDFDPVASLEEIRKVIVEPYLEAFPDRRVSPEPALRIKSYWTGLAMPHEVIGGEKG